MTTKPKKKAPKRTTKPAKKRTTKKTAAKTPLGRVLAAKNTELELADLPRSPLWELVDEGTVDGRTPTMFTVRAPVPGGWLVAVSMRGLIAPPVYVPDPTASWLRRKPEAAPVVEPTLEADHKLEAVAPATATEADTTAPADEVTHGGDPGDEAAA